MIHRPQKWDRPTRALAQEMGKVLSPFEKKMRQAQLRQIAHRLLLLLPGHAPAPAQLLGDDLFTAGIMNTIRSLEAERDSAGQSLEQAASMLSRSTTPASKRRILNDLALKKGVFFSQFNRRLTQYIGPDTLREKHERQIAEATQLILLAMKLMAAWVVRGQASNHRAALNLAIKRTLKELGVEGFLLARAQKNRGAIRLGAFLALEELLMALQPNARADTLGLHTQRLLVSILGSGSDTPWNQLSAARLISLVDSQEGLKLIEARLRQLGSAPNDFIIKRGLIGVIQDYHRVLSGFRVLQQLARAHDASEAVRMRLVTGLSHYHGPMVADELMAMEACEKSPRVLAKLAKLWSAWLLDGEEWQKSMAQERLIALLEGNAPELAIKAALQSLFYQENGPKIPDVEMGFLIRPLEAALSKYPKLSALIHYALEICLIQGHPAMLQALNHIQQVAARTPPGKRFHFTPSQPLESAELGRILALLAHRDHGLYAEITRTGYRITRGDTFTTRLWRILHELRNPAPNKRQGHAHTVGRKFRGDLRAHPHLLAESTATGVPGERLLLDANRGWAAYLPQVDDLLDIPLFGPKRVELYTPQGLTRIQAPRGFFTRLRTRLFLIFAYKWLADLRHRSAHALEWETRHHYIRYLETRLGFKITFQHHAKVGAQPELQKLFLPPPNASPEAKHASTLAALMPVPELTQGWDGWRLAVGELMSRLTGDVKHISLFVSVLLVYTLIQTFIQAVIARADRRAIPMVIGGWGTRGKSGTERLKAALLMGQGYEVLVKTTGCEAMVIHCIPGFEARELLLHRPYDKASIWEHRRSLRMARKLGVQAFLYECMALQTHYVHIIQRIWSRDDISTITNAYPDHEDLQGPSGQDVAQTIAQFIGANATVLTTEEEMLPIFREEARKMGSKLVAIDGLEADLIPQDFLNRFSYEEHPRNIALVAALAAQLGIDGDRALIDMADRVVLDIGVLKSYPQVHYLGRKLEFISGNSANERTGYLSNWSRMAFATHNPQVDRNTWLMTVVNNRADRPTRTRLFAEILTRDLAVHRHLLIGTNLGGLRRHLRQSLDALSDSLTLILDGDETPLSPEKRLQRQERFQRYLAHLKIGELSPLDIILDLSAQCRGLGWMVLAERLEGHRTLYARLQGVIQDAVSACPGPPKEDYLHLNQRGLEGELVQIMADLSPPDAPTIPAMGPLPPWAMPADAAKDGQSTQSAQTLSQRDLMAALAEFTVQKTVYIRRLAHIQALFEGAMDGKISAQAVNAAFQAAYRDIFWDRVYLIEDPNVSGDQIIQYLTKLTPPGVCIRIMGTQNIKGTGLDMVYRFKSLETICKRLENLDTMHSTEALRWFRNYPDYGYIDAQLARLGIAALAEKSGALQLTAEKEFAMTCRHLDEVIAQKRPDNAVQSRPQKPWFHWLEVLIEPIRSIHRHRRARDIARALVHGTISHERAADEMLRLNKEQKGGWFNPFSP